MTTATTNLGPNSWVVSFSMGSTIAEIMTAVTAVLTGASGAGWEVYDATAGTNTVCYRAPNEDGLTYKYMVLNYNTSGWMLIQHYESWNSSTHVGTNVCPRSTDTTIGYQQALVPSTDKGLIYIFANQRYASFIIRQYTTAVLGNTITCGITGCFEFNRDNPDDTVEAGYPVSCFLNTGIVGENAVATNETISIPRTRLGSTGTAQYGEISTVFGKTLYTTPWVMKNMIPTAVSLFSNKDWAISMYVQDGTPAAPSVRGRIFGLKVFTQNKLNFMDKIQVPCDANLNYDPNGSLTDHYVIPGGKQGAGLYTVRFLIPA